MFLPLWPCFFLLALLEKPCSITFTEREADKICDILRRDDSGQFARLSVEQKLLIVRTDKTCLSRGGEGSAP